MNRPDTNVFEYKCPNCGGAVAFDSTAQKLVCPYCDTEFDVGALQNNDAALANAQTDTDSMEWYEAEQNQWTEDEVSGMRSYICNSCGGEIIGDANTAATSCPFCGNHTIMMSNFTGSLKPHFVIPFKKDKEFAKQQLLKFYEGKKLLPKAFKDSNHIDEIKGVYVPFWLFDTTVDAKMRFKATRSRAWTSGGYDYVETEHFAIDRAGKISFEKVPVDGSTKMADDMMESIEPYDFRDAVPFSTAYLSGFFADKYDVDADTCIQRANERIKRSAEQKMKRTVSNYATVTTESSVVNFENGVTSYAFYPVWMLGTTYEGKRYTFAMNAQTGKFVGDDLPVDKKKSLLYLLAMAAGFGAAIFAAIALFLAI